METDDTLGYEAINPFALRTVAPPKLTERELQAAISTGQCSPAMLNVIALLRDTRMTEHDVIALANALAQQIGRRCPRTERWRVGITALQAVQSALTDGLRFDAEGDAR